MQRRILNLRLKRVGNVLKMHVNEVQEFFDKPDLNPSIARTAFALPRTINSFLYRSVALLNGLNPASRQAHNLYEFYKEENHNRFVQDPRKPSQYCEYNYLKLNLPSDPAELFRLLVAVDGAVHELRYNAPMNGCAVSTHYCDHLSDDPNSDEVIRHTYDADRKSRLQPKQSLSRHLATWIVREVDNDQVNLSKYRAAADALEEFMKSDNDSLAYDIRNWLYPRPLLHDVLMKVCHDDSIISTLLDPSTSHRKATLTLMGSLRETMQVHKNAPMAELKRGISAFFTRLTRAREDLWNLMIDDLYAHQAVFGGCYHQEYSEIKLLREAKFYLNNDGLMVLDIKNTKSYAAHYAKCANVDNKKLELELRFLCKYLGLQFLFNQDFHENPIFTKDSTRLLVNLKVHLTEKYYKRLTLAAQTMRLFPKKDKDDANPNLMRAVPIELQADITSRAFNVHVKDLEVIARADRAHKL